jgi:hypothetical protein
VSPAQLLFGNAIQLDRAVFDTPMPAETNSEGGQAATTLPKGVTVSKLPPNWLDKMLDAQADIISFAIQNQKDIDENHVKERSGWITEFEIGSYVLVRYSNAKHSTGKLTKFHTIWKGPLRVVNSIGSRYSLQNLITNEQEDVHVTNLKPFLYDADRVDPRVIAMGDAREFQIEKVLAHDGDTKRVSTLSFKVRWLGYDESNDSWEPWKELRLTTQLHDYLRANKLASLIPKSITK